MLNEVGSMLAVAAMSLLMRSPAHAADRAVHLQALRPIRPGVAAVPLIADPANDAERRINTALLRLNASVRRGVAACKGDAGAPGHWDRTVDMPMRGPGYLSVVITDNAFCGGAHPATATMSIVYDLRTGSPVNWTRLLPPTLTGDVALAAGIDGTKMVTLASARLQSLFLAGYDYGTGSADDRASCKAAVQNIGDTDPPAMMAWLDAKHGGLAVQYDLSHVVQECAVPVVIPVATLRSEGAEPALLAAVEAAHGK